MIVNHIRPDGSVQGYGKVVSVSAHANVTGPTTSVVLGFESRPDEHILKGRVDVFTHEMENVARYEISPGRDYPKNATEMSKIINAAFGVGSATGEFNPTGPTTKLIQHRSDCAVHNEPYQPNGPCDCGAVYEPNRDESDKNREAWAGYQARGQAERDGRTGANATVTDTYRTDSQAKDGGLSADAVDLLRGPPSGLTGHTIKGE